MARTIFGQIRMFDGKRWTTQRAEFIIESETDPAQEANDRRLARGAERTKRAKELAREFEGSGLRPALSGGPTSWDRAPESTKRAIVFILDQELPSL